MWVGQVWPAEWGQCADPVSGAKVRRLTPPHKEHSHHLCYGPDGYALVNLFHIPDSESL